MKVQMYSNFIKKKKLGKNEISKLHEDHPSKCRGKVQKIGEETLKGLFSKLLIPAPLFGLMKSTLASWLQHMPTLPRLLKFSNTHNF
jgi:hypothetical protein